VYRGKAGVVKGGGGGGGGGESESESKSVRGKSERAGQ